MQPPQAALGSESADAPGGCGVTFVDGDQFG
jgi:hypothetical protein